MQARGPACLVLELTPPMIVCRAHLMPFRRLGGPFTTRRMPRLILNE